MERRSVMVDEEEKKRRSRENREKAKEMEERGKTSSLLLHILL